jgi:uncharacterized protein YjbI with pentapeptide repeats
MTWGIDPTIMTAAVALAAAALGGAWWLWWRLPKRQVDRLQPMIFDSAARANAEDNIRKTIGQLLGGAAVLIGAGLAYVQFLQQQQASHDLLISNQIAKGFELLSNKENLTQRLGGIYALEGVMNTSEQYHQPILEALGAFVREGTQNVTGDGRPDVDIQAALTVLGRSKAIGTGAPDLGNAKIPQAQLSGANLDGANLNGANLIGADLSGAVLSDANLISADISQTQLDQACGTEAKLNSGLTLKPCP